MTTIFMFKTSEAFLIKTLIELLQHSIPTAGFEINASGIFLRSPDTQKRMIFDIELKRDNFDQYRYDYCEESIKIGLDISSLYRMLKIIKKKDCLKWIIYEEELTKLYVEISPKESGRLKVIDSIPILAFQNIIMQLPNEFTHHVTINSDDYKCIIKGIKDQVNDSMLAVSMSDYSVKFSYSKSPESVFSKHVLFGDELEPFVSVYYDEFDVEQFSQINKLSSLCKKIKMYSGDHRVLPLKMEVDIGNLGKISIYIKSRNQIKGYVN